MRYVQRDNTGRITGTFSHRATYATEELEDDHPDVVEFQERREARFNPPAPKPRITGYQILARLESLLGHAAAKQARQNILASDPIGYDRMMTSPNGVALDDERLIAGLTALGLDAAAILAPD